MARQGCFGACCPYPLVTIPGCVAFLAMLFTWYSAGSCNFYRITDTFQEGNETITALRIGLWSVEDVNATREDYQEDNWYHEDGDWDDEQPSCTTWEEAKEVVGPPASTIEFDSAMTAARVFSLFAALLGVVAFGLVVVPCCTVFDDPTMYIKIVAGVFVTLGVSTILNLVALASDICADAESCTLETAGILAIVSSILWFTCAGLMFLAFKNARTLRGTTTVAYPVEAIVPQSVATTERDIRTVENADGSVTTITKTTITNADGSKTVTETTAPAPIAESTPMATSMPITETTQTASVLSVEGEAAEPVASATKSGS